MDRFDDFPRLGSGVGYATFKRNAKGIEKAGGTDADALAEALRGLELDTPLGPIEMRAADQQSTMGTFVGRLTVQDGMPRMVDWQYHDGQEYMPSEEEATELRRGNCRSGEQPLTASLPDGATSLQLSTPEIVRPSCRERGCQSV